MDISKLSDKELLELQKDLMLEIKKREVFAKGITDGWKDSARAYIWTEKYMEAIAISEYMEKNK